MGRLLYIVRRESSLGLSNYRKRISYIKGVLIIILRNLEERLED